MEKRKLKLDQIKVESFITAIKPKEQQTINGEGSILGICIISIDGEACEIGPIRIEPSAICIPNSINEGACSLLICTPVTKGTLECPSPGPEREACSVFRRGSCGGTIGA